ncbi:hypothetical protein [Treponema sp.]|uniref:pectate lyase family protein n=1 Tax=Treponema sp. TaxID=166 RepID=UPI00388EE2E6
MKRFKLLKIFTALASLSLLAANFTGCSDISSAADEVTTAYGRVAFTVPESVTLTDIVFKGTDSSTSKTTTFGSWSTASELEAETIAIPVGEYTFYLSATYEGDSISGSTTGTITANSTTALTFELKRNSVTVPDDDEEAETTVVGTYVTEGTYSGYYQVMDWNASDYLFGLTTASDSSQAATAGTYGDVTLISSKFKANVTASTETESGLICNFLQASKGGSMSQCLKFVVPVNVSYITINAKCGTKDQTDVAMKIATTDESSVQSFTFSGSNYTTQEFAYSLTAADGETQKVVCLYNADENYSLNIKGISVYAPTKWEKTNTTISTKTSTSANAETYEPTNQTITVDMTVTTDASSSGSSVTIQKAEGWLNSMYVIFNNSGSTYTITCDGNTVDNELIRKYSTYKYNELSYSEGQSTWTEKSYSNVIRVDVLGLAAGSHTISITPAGGSATTVTATVLNHDRSGYAFSGTETPGAYKSDGTLKSDAVVLYVTKDNAKTITYNDCTGLQAILDESSVKKLTVPLDIRVIGKLSKSDLDYIASSSEGLQIKNNKSPITFEGVGHDATIWGFGFLIRNSTHVEVSNLGIMCFMDDALSLDTQNYYSWMHNIDIFYGSTGGDSDQAKGDGSLDVKGKSNWQAYSYNHFWDSGKCSLCGMKSESTDSRLTYHHNWFDHSDSRHPRIRVQTVHIYNNYFDGNAKYGVGVTMGSSAFVESNFFRNPHDPMMSSGQGTDATGDGTFSGEAGGWIKAYNNKFYQLGYNGVKFQYMTNKDYPDDSDIDAYVVDNRTDTVPSTLKTVSGGTTYSNFDTSESLYLAEGSLQEPDAALTSVLKFSGRHNPDFAWTFDNSSEDANYSLISALKSAVVAYTNTGLTSVGQ